MSTQKRVKLENGTVIEIHGERVLCYDQCGTDIHLSAAYEKMLLVFVNNLNKIALSTDLYRAYSNDNNNVKHSDIGALVNRKINCFPEKIRPYIKNSRGKGYILSGELIKEIMDPYQVLGKSIHEQNQKTENSLRLLENRPYTRSFCKGRDDIIQKIHQCFSKGDRLIFLEGIGGIGKSEIAKEYCIRHGNDYDIVIFTTFSSSIKQLICDANSVVIEGMERHLGETEEEYFWRKIQIMRRLTTERTLIVVDNFDVFDDSAMDVFCQGSHKLLFTSRYSHCGYTSIPVPPITDRGVLTTIFERNYGSRISESDKVLLYEIFEKLEYHTYCIELLAKQMRASFWTLNRMLDIIKDEELSFAAHENISGRHGLNTAFQHLCILFNTSTLSDTERQVLMNLSLSDIRGIPAQWFKKWSQFDDFNVINKLIQKSWIREEAGQIITLHPLIREVIHSVLNPTVDKCRNYLSQMAHFCYVAWYQTSNNKLAIANTVESILLYFRKLDGKEFALFQCFTGFLWQVGRFEASIYHSERLFKSCLKEYGLNSLETGYVAKLVGACYHNSGYNKESIWWYKQGLNSMLNSGKEESEDIAMAYEKVARCYTWEYEQDFKKAEEYFAESHRIRKELISDVQQGKIITDIIQYEQYDLNLLLSRLGGLYMEIGRMHQRRHNYEEAIQYAERYLENILEYSPSNRSGAAYGYYDIGISQYYLSMQYSIRGEGQKAEKLLVDSIKNLETALKINKEMRGDQAIDTLDNQEYLADAYVAQGKQQEAYEGYNAAVTMAEKLFGENHSRAKQIKEKITLQVGGAIRNDHS